MSDGGAYERFYDEVGALVSGSTTYEFVLDHLHRFAYFGVAASQAMGSDFGELPFQMRGEMHDGAARFLARLEDKEPEEGAFSAFGEAIRSALLDDAAQQCTIDRATRLLAHAADASVAVRSATRCSS